MRGEGLQTSSSALILWGGGLILECGGDICSILMGSDLDVRALGVLCRTGWAVVGGGDVIHDNEDKDTIQYTDKSTHKIIQ